MNLSGYLDDGKVALFFIYITPFKEVDHNSDLDKTVPVVVV